MNLYDQRLDVCRGCPQYVEALQAGACRLIRDPELRVSTERFRLAITNGTWPQSQDDSAGCLQPSQDFNRKGFRP